MLWRRRFCTLPTAKLTAFVDATAKVHPSVILGPYAVVEAHAIVYIPKLVCLHFLWICLQETLHVVDS